MTRLLYVLVVVCAANVARAADLHVADIQALAKTGAWVELLARAPEVAPSERDVSWNDAVNKAAAARANDPAVTDYVIMTECQSLLQTYPFLASNRAFMDARGRRGFIAFQGCFRDAYDVAGCLEHARAFVDADPKNATLARDMGKLVAMNTAPKAPAVEFYHRAVAAARAQGEAGAKQLKETCGDDYLASAAAAALVNFQASEPVVPKAKELVFDWCWANMDTAKLVKDVLQDDSANGLKNGCAGFLSKKALSGARESKCKKAPKQ